MIRQTQFRAIRGMTLMEMILALTIFTIISTSVCSLVIAAFNVDRYTVASSGAVWDADFAWHRISANAVAAIPSAAGGMTPVVTTDANGQSRLTFIVPDIANNTTRTLRYYCTGASAPFTLVEDDTRYNVAGTANPIAYKVQTFSASIDATTTLKIWVDLKLNPTSGGVTRRHFCVNPRDF